MKLLARLSAVLIIIAGLISLGCPAWAHPEVANGLIDLSSWNPHSDGVVKLEGKWEFSWKELLEPHDFTVSGPLPGAGLVSVPGSWDGYRAQSGETAGSSGYATYRLRVRTDQIDQFALYIPYASTSYRLWIDERFLGGNGTVGSTPAAAAPQYVPQVFRFRPENSDFQIIAQVANFVHRRGGLWNVPVLGTAAQIDRYVTSRLAVAALLFGSILIVGLHHLTLYLFRRKDRAPLYFGIFCLLVALRSSVTGEVILLRLFPDFPWHLHIKLEYCFTYLALPAFMLFLKSVFPRVVHEAPVRMSILLGAALSLLLVFVSVLSASNWIPFFQLVLSAYIVYMAYVIIEAVRRGEDGAGLFFAGGLVGLLTVIHDIFFYNLLVTTGELVPYGMFVLIFFQSLVLAHRFSDAHLRQSILSSQNAQLLAVTREQLDELRQYRRLVASKHEEIRREIAEILHGRVQNRLLAAWYAIGEVLRGVPDADESNKLLQEARRHIDEVREQDVRQVSHLLHPSIIQAGLLSAVRSLAKLFQDSFSISIQASAEVRRLDDPRRNSIPENIRLVTYRVLEEALNNVAKHAGADNVTISFNILEKNLLQIRIKDDGLGLKGEDLKFGLGLFSLAARVKEFGGEWDITGTPGGGTTLTVTLPIHAFMASRESAPDHTFSPMGGGRGSSSRNG